MLILTRKQNESIVIDDDIKVTVLSDKHGQVSGLPLIRMPSGVLPSEYRDPATQKTEWFRCKIDGMAINPHIVTLD